MALLYFHMLSCGIIKALHKVIGRITDRIPITNRDLIGPGPITDRDGQSTGHMPIISRNAF